MEFKRTRLVQEIENDLKISVPKYLREKYQQGWSYGDIARDIENVSPSTIGRWINQLGYSTRNMAALAWEHGLAPASPYEAVV